MIALVNGQQMIRELGWLLLFGLALAILWYMGYYFFSKPPVPPIVMIIWNGLFVLLGGFFLINLLLSIGGHPLVTW
jgi:hypothetical protein